MNYKVIKSKKGYGYSIQSSERKSWINDGYVFGWYRLKSRAQERADELNRARI